MTTPSLNSCVVLTQICSTYKSWKYILCTMILVPDRQLTSSCRPKFYQISWALRSLHIISIHWYAVSCVCCLQDTRWWHVVVLTTCCEEFRFVTVSVEPLNNLIGLPLIFVDLSFYISFPRVSAGSAVPPQQVHMKSLWLASLSSFDQRWLKVNWRISPS